MDPIKKILVPLALTRSAEGVYGCAARTAQKHDADLLILSVINLRDIHSVESIVAMGYDVDADHYLETVKQERKNILNRMVDKGELDADRVKILFKVGHPAEEILKVIKKEQPDLVVMGTRGRTGMKAGSVGAVAEKIFKRSPVTVLSFRDEKAKKSLEKKID